MRDEISIELMAALNRKPELKAAVKAKFEEWREGDGRAIHYELFRAYMVGIGLQTDVLVDYHHFSEAMEAVDPFCNALDLGLVAL